MRSFLLTLFATLSISATPVVTAINPASGLTTGGTYVHIIGSDLNGYALACPSIECSTYVHFDDADAPIVTNTSTEIVAIAPAHAAGSAGILVNIAGKGKVAIGNGFRYEQPNDTDYERVLIPVTGNALGAFGSDWRTTVTMYNASDTRVFPNAPVCNPRVLSPCPLFFIDPHATIHPTFYPDAGSPGVIVRVPRAAASDIDIQARVRDFSRQSQTWGTEIPVVRETDYRRVVRLHDVPTDARFRTTLRVYGYDSQTYPVDVRIYDETSAHKLIASAIVDEQQDFDGSTYAQINSLAETFPQISAFDTVSVEIESRFTPRPPLWALASVTNNETQHVTIIVPR